MIKLTHFIRNACAFMQLLSDVISQLCGSSTMQKKLNKSCRYISSALDDVHTKHHEDKVLSLWLIISWFKFFRNCYTATLLGFLHTTVFQRLHRMVWETKMGKWKVCGWKCLAGKKKKGRKRPNWFELPESISEHGQNFEPWGT